MHFLLTVEGNICLLFGGTGGCFVRSAVPRLLKSLGSVHECQGSSSKYVKALLVTFNVFSHIHKCMCLSEASTQKHSCTVSLLCRKLRPRGWGTSGSLWQRCDTSDTQGVHRIFPHTRYLPEIEAETSITRSQWTISHGIQTVSEQRQQPEVFLCVFLHWMQWWLCERHRCWFVLYNWTVQIYLFIYF